jgi:hypothetical protein
MFDELLHDNIQFESLLEYNPKQKKKKKKRRRRRKNLLYEDNVQKISHIQYHKSDC